MFMPPGTFIKKRKNFFLKVPDFATFILPVLLLDPNLRPQKKFWQSDLIVYVMENHVKMTASAENFYLSGTEPGSTEGRCLECGNRISYGSRADRKFCCDKCKNRWHNKRTRNSRLFRIRVINALEKNYRILSGLIKMDVDTVPVTVLGQMGFDFSHITGYRKGRKSTEMWCYDISFTVTETLVKSIGRLDII